MSGKSSHKAFTKEEELLLQDFSRNVSTKSSALFYGNAFIVSAIPIWLFWRVHMIDIYSSFVWFIGVTLVSTYLMAMAYRNTKFQLKHKVAVKREDAVAREMYRKLAEDKKMSKKEKDERILWKKNEVADYEATTFSIFYNNALFLAIVIFSSFYFLRSFTPAAILQGKLLISVISSIYFQKKYIMMLLATVATFAFCLFWEASIKIYEFLKRNYIFSITSTSALLALLSTGTM